MTYPLDDFWANVDAALTRCGEATTVEDVITILNEHFNPSSGAAFFGGSGGDTRTGSPGRTLRPAAVA